MKYTICEYDGLGINPPDDCRNYPDWPIGLMPLQFPEVHYNGVCGCGRKFDSTAASTPLQETTCNGKIIYFVCGHGVVLVDERLAHGIKE